MVFIETHVAICTSNNRPHMGVESYVYLLCAFFSVLLILSTFKFKYSAHHLCQESVNI